MITLKDTSIVNHDAINNLLINAKTPYTQQSHTVGNILAQIGRIPGGIAQGTIKAISAPGLLKESIDNKVRDKGQASSLQVKNEAVNAFNNGNAYTNFAAKANQGVENRTNSWVAPPETKAAEFAAVAFDAVGEAIPGTAAAVATGGNALVGNALSYGIGSAAAFSSEMLEGSGDVGMALVRAGTAYASEALGGKLFGSLSAGTGIKSLAGGALGEGLEENIDGVLFSAATGDSYTLPDAVQDFAVGAVAGAALGGAGKAVNAVNAAVTPGLVESNVKNQTENHAKAGGVSAFIAPSPETSFNSHTTDSTPQNTGGNGTGRTEIRESVTRNNMESSNSGSGRITTEISAAAMPYAGIRTEGNPQSLEFGYADSDGNAVPSTPDTEPWKFPDPDPNTIPFPDAPDADPDTEPAVDPQIIPFPSPAQPEPNTIPFPTPVQPDTDTPATDPQVIPFPSTPEPDPTPVPEPEPDVAPNTIPFPEQPSVTPDINPDAEPNEIPVPIQPDISTDPNINTEPDVPPDGVPEITPQTDPQNDPVTQPLPQSVPGVSPGAAPQEEPNPLPNINPSPQTQPGIQTSPSTNPDAAPDIQTQTAPQVRPNVNTDPQTLARSIWLPEQAAREANAMQPNPAPDTNNNRRRERDGGSFDFHITRGPGSTGRVYETTGYNATFGGLSSY